jgi:predicted Rossmann-fold nucleotide-binding protein
MATEATILLIAGSRDVRGFSYDDFVREMDAHIARQGHVMPHLVITGGAQGVDSYGRRWALERKLPYEELKPDWEKHGRSAGLLRNTDLVAKATQVILFWDGESPGTTDTRRKAMNVGKLIHVHMFRH